MAFFFLVGCQSPPIPHATNLRSIDPRAEVYRVQWRSDPNREEGALPFSFERQKLLSLAGNADLILLFLLGGAHGSRTAENGGMWCEDTRQELALYRRLSERFPRSSRIRFVSVFCPPVYGDGGYGDAREKFLDSPQESSTYREAILRFVENTESLHKDGILPFERIFFDPGFRLLWNRRKELPKNRVVEEWEGLFKAKEDMQNYGTPTIWILSRDGEAMCEPFWGNNYPDKIRYRYEDVADAIVKATKVLEMRSSKR